MSRDINTINRIYEEKNLQLLLNMIEEKIDEHRDEIKSQRQQGNNPEKRLIKADLRALKILRDDVKSTIKKSTEIEKARDLEDYVPRLVLSLGIQNTTEFSENVKHLLKGVGIKSPNGVFLGAN
jgi:hypothetical protein